MDSPGSLGNICRYILDYGEDRYAEDPVRLGCIFRECTGIQRTPSLTRTINLVRSLGIKIEAVDYLNTGGTNMMPKGNWHIHYSAKDRPATQKFTIFHELFEVVHKNLAAMDDSYRLLKEPQLSKCADRFAAAALIPPRFFSDKASANGCDLVKLGRDLELSHQCLLIALGQHFADVPFVGVLYEHRMDGANDEAEIKRKSLSVGWRKWFCHRRTRKQNRGPRSCSRRHKNAGARGGIYPLARGQYSRYL